MKLSDIDLAYIATRFSETSTWLSINAGLLGAGIVVPDATFHRWEAAGMALATLAGIILPQIGKPITTDVGQARIDAGLPLTGHISSGTTPTEQTK